MEKTNKEKPRRGRPPLPPGSRRDDRRRLRAIKRDEERDRVVEPPAVTWRRLLEPAETAEILGVTVNTLAKFRMDGRGPQWVRVGGCIRYEFCALDEYIRGATQPTSDHPLV